MSDPTAIDLVGSPSTDPLKRIMEGRTYHGSLDFKAPFMSEIADNLWNGGCEHGLVLPTRIDHLVSLYQWESYKVSHPLMSRLVVKMYDALGEPDTDQVLALARWVNVCRKTGEVLVHCQAGLNRSGMVVATALMLDGMTADEAISHLREKRSHASLCNPSFEEFLRNLEV
jgi:protein-tyrosine phosphatase